MTNQYSLTCPTCKIERQVTKDNYNFHIRTKSSGQCRPCRIKEFNSRSENKRGYVNGIPAKKHPYYHVWRNMIRRCYDPKVRSYKDYGGRGITICEEWMDSKGFLTWVDSYGDIENGYELDRINNDGNYEPSNCRFIARSENCQNRRSTKLNWKKVREIRDKFRAKLSISAIATEYCVSASTISSIINYRIWKEEKEEG